MRSLAAVRSLAANSRVAFLAYGFDRGGQDVADPARYDAVVVDVDTPEATIRALGSKGMTVICYFSVGSSEPFRADYRANLGAWRAVELVKMQGWEEYWLDVTRLEQLAALMGPRFEAARAKGCHGVEPDNVDCFSNPICASRLAGGSLTSAAQLKAAQVAYNRWQIGKAHSLDLLVGLKNAAELVAELGAEYDFAIAESCVQYKECGVYAPMLALDKAVVGLEYSLRMAGLCRPCAQKCSSAAQGAFLFGKYCAGSDGNVCSSSGQWQGCLIDVAKVDYSLAGSALPSGSVACPCPLGVADGSDLGFGTLGTPAPTAPTAPTRPTLKPTRRPSGPAGAGVPGIGGGGGGGLDSSDGSSPVHGLGPWVIALFGGLLVLAGVLTLLHHRLLRGRSAKLLSASPTSKPLSPQLSVLPITPLRASPADTA
jgi:hypothetical protein